MGPFFHGCIRSPVEVAGRRSDALFLPHHTGLARSRPLLSPQRQLRGQPNQGISPAQGARGWIPVPVFDESSARAAHDCRPQSPEAARRWRRGFATSGSSNFCTALPRRHPATVGARRAIPQPCDGKDAARANSPGHGRHRPPPRSPQRRSWHGQTHRHRLPRRCRAAFLLQIVVTACGYRR